MTSGRSVLDRSLLQRAIPDGSMRYFAWLYTPHQHRETIAASFLLESELRDTARAPHDVAHIRLQWWREELDRLNKGNAQHPATLVLQAHRNSNTDFSLLENLLLSTAQDIAHATYDTDAELQQYTNNYGSLVRFISTMICDGSSPTLSDAATKLGSFIRTVETLRDLRADIHHGHAYLPLNELDQLEVEYETLESKEWPPGFVYWLQSRCQSILKTQVDLQNALLKSEATQLRPLLVLAALHEKLLSLLAKDVANFDSRLELKPFSKLWTAWRTARRT